jgi:parallel beta-helix repeat protein
VIGNTASFNSVGLRFEDDGSARNRIVGNAFIDNRLDGISIDGVDALVLGNYATGGNTGFFVHLDNSIVRGNVIRNNRTGIEVPSGAGNLIQGNLVTASAFLDMWDHNAQCVNTWKGNTFNTDSEGDGPRAGCIR